MNERNRYKVPARQWAKWPEIARWVFNSTFSEMARQPEWFLPPGAVAPPKKQWRVTAWNAAFTAASRCKGWLNWMAEGGEGSK